MTRQLPGDRGRLITTVSVFGARPNLMKVAPVHHAMVKSGRISPLLIDTGQHYDEAMSRVFREEFSLPEADAELGVGSGSHAQQTARVMERLEPILQDLAPDVVVVFGDVNSTLAASITAAKLWIPVAHVEAGLRSFDRSMPEEINRILTDAIADILFTHSPEAIDNLVAEGIARTRIFDVGNVMIDTLDRCLIRARENSKILLELGLEEGTFVLATLHRPANVDQAESLGIIVDTLRRAAGLAPVVLVVHPRTRLSLQEHDVETELRHAGVLLVEPLGYLDFLRLLDAARAVLTDSGGIQEETTVLGVGCVTLRDSTERPITVSHGTNRLVGRDPEVAMAALTEALTSQREPRRPSGWDGRAAERIVEVLLAELSDRS